MLSDFGYEFNSADRYGRCLESLEAQHGSDSLFNAPVILFDSII